MEAEKGEEGSSYKVFSSKAAERSVFPAFASGLGGTGLHLVLATEKKEED